MNPLLVIYLLGAGATAAGYFAWLLSFAYGIKKTWQGLFVVAMASVGVGLLWPLAIGMAIVGIVWSRMFRGIV